LIGIEAKVWQKKKTKPPYGADIDTRLANSIETVNIFRIFALIEMGKIYKKG